MSIQEELKELLDKIKYCQNEIYMAENENCQEVKFLADSFSKIQQGMDEIEEVIDDMIKDENK